MKAIAKIATLRQLKRIFVMREQHSNILLEHASKNQRPRASLLRQAIFHHVPLLPSRTMILLRNATVLVTVQKKKK